MKLAVIGDACTDTYVYGLCERLSPEGPVPVLNQHCQHSNGGMSLNVFRNLCNMIDGNHHIDHYSNDYHIMEKIRFVDEKTNQLLLRVDVDDKCNRISSDAISRIKINKYDAVVVSDYCKGFMTDEDLINLGMSSPISFLDSKRKLTKEVMSAFNLIKLNEHEYKLNKELVDRFPKRFVITLGSKGVMFLNQRYEPPKVLQTYDVSGAGDTFLSAVVSKVINKEGMDTAIKFAQECCNKVIQERGTCVYKKDMD